MLDQLVHFVFYAIIAAAIIGLLLYAVNISPIPEPFKGWLRFAVILIAIFVIIYMLLGLAGGNMPRLHVGQAQIGAEPGGGISYVARQ